MDQLNSGAVFGPGAEVRMSKSQLGFIVALGIGSVMLGLVLQLTFLQYLQGFVALSTLFFASMFVFSSIVAVSGMKEGSLVAVDDSEALALNEFPYITVIVPSYVEPAVARQIVKSIWELNYPKNRMQVLIVLEEGDFATIEAYTQLALPKHFKVIVRPKGGAKTKPAAMNYLFDQGYVHWRSDFTVVFDSEDKPDKLQPRKAMVSYFREVVNNPHLVCVQARLAFSQNANRSWVTRMLNLDYLQHFSIMLPGLTRLGLVSPLGGTSNYILTSAIREVGGWDSLNVTEDMDLAVKFARLGYSTLVLDSITSEEAVENAFDMVKQRSRWIKGAIQTYFRHMRNPIRLQQELGWKGFVGFQYVIGAPLVLYLVNPVFWGMTAIYAVTHSEFIQQLYPPLIFYVAMFCFSAGNYMYVYMLKTAAFRTKNYSNVIMGLFAPLYWLLISIAGYVAVYQFLKSNKAAQGWSKTHHKGDNMEG